MPIGKGWAEAQSRGDVPSSGNRYFDTGSMEAYKAAVADTSPYVQPEYVEGTPFSQGWEHERQKKGDVPSSGNNWFDTGSKEAGDKAKLVTPVGTYDRATNTFIMAPNSGTDGGSTDGGSTDGGTNQATEFTTPEGVVVPPSNPSQEWLMGTMNNPALPAGTQQISQQQKIDEATELIKQGTGQAQQLTPQAAAQSAAASMVAQQAAAQEDAAAQPGIEMASRTAVQGQAATGEVTAESTIRGQLELLMEDITSGDAPWADEAVRLATATMSRRGMGNSSMAAKAITQAVIEAAMPIATYDAQVYGAMNIQNLRNRQETMLGNTAASNVAINLNTNDANEIKKYMTTIRDGIVRFNATKNVEMAAYNNTEMNKAAAQNANNTTEVARQNAIQQNQMTAMYARERNAVEMYNQTNAMQNTRANVEYYRSVNTMNTAAANAANSVNTANLFNMSEQAKADLVQESRDIFDWANKNAESTIDRAYNLAQYAIQRNDYMQDMDAAQRAQLQQGVGNLLFELFKEGLNIFDQSQQAED